MIGFAYVCMQFLNDTGSDLTELNWISIEIAVY